MSIRPLSRELQKKAETILDEEPDKIQKFLQDIKSWLSRQPHLKVRDDDQWLISFLRTCKYRLQRTQESLDFFHRFKTVASEYYARRDPFHPEIQAILSSGAVVFLPNALSDPAAPRTLIIRPECVDPDKISLLSIIKIGFMILDILTIEDDNFVVSGHILMIDGKNTPYTSYLPQINMSTIKYLIRFGRSARRFRIQQVQVVNAFPTAMTLFNMAKYLIPDKVLQRIVIHEDSNLESILSNIPSSILPKEYRGEGKTLQELIDDMKSKVESYKDWFTADNMYGSDESKRPENLKIENDFFGLEGSFRHLKLD